MNRLLRLLLAFVGFLALASCSSVTEPLGMEDPFAIPQPFKEVGRNQDMIAQAIRVTVLVVQPPVGMPDEESLPLRDRIVTLAQAQDIPALPSATTPAWSLQGQAAKVQLARAGAQGVIVWRVLDPEGIERTKFSVPYRTAKAELGEDDLRRVAQTTVNELDAALLRPDTQIASQLAPAVKPVVWVDAIKGAPGDGNQSLARALTGVLPLKGVLLAEGPKKAQWRVEGSVKVVQRSPTEDVVTLTWQVRDAAGKVAGNIAQENAVPHGRLGKPWREVAGFAAEAAAEGIAQLIQQVSAGSKG